jgi:nucleoid-associated protein YgaU
MDAGEAIAEYIRVQGLQVDNLKVSFDGASSTVHVSGTAKDQATKEKVILCCGNIAGVEQVTDDLAVQEPAPEAQYHTVVKGDTLSAIAKKYYGDASKYPEIFEANKPMLKDPNKIYPGQSLRIPARH